MRKYQKRLSVLAIALLALLLIIPVQAQTGMTVEAADQLSLDGAVTVSTVVADAPSFLAIHADNGGALGDVIGYTAVGSGENHDVRVAVDATKATPILYAVLHTDDNTIGTFEFGKVNGADAPIVVNNQTVSAPFHINTLQVSDQIVKDQVTIARVIVQQPSWVVVHAGDANGFGDAIGHAFVDRGVTTNLAVAIDPTKRTDILWPMIHTDTGTAGAFEFGTVDMTDLPLTLGDKAATVPILTVPNIRTADKQLVLGNNGIVLGNAATVVVESVLSDGPGFLTIHNEVNGAAGDVIGFTPVPSGLSTDVKVSIDPALVTPNLWPVLHIDDHTRGTFEFGKTNGADAPAVVNNQPVAFAVTVAPFLHFQQKQALDNNQILISQALVDSPGFVIVQADDGKGHPGAVLGQVPINAGLNQNIAAALNTNQVTNPLYVTLHTDTNQIGVYETGNGLDSPVLLNNQPILGQLTLTGNLPAASNAAAANSAAAATFPCTVTLGSSAQVNLRSGPGTNFDIVTTLTGGETLTFTSQTQDTDGFTWWQTSDGRWVRSDVTGAVDACKAPSP